jgi:hypothetical protein
MNDHIHLLPSTVWDLTNSADGYLLKGNLDLKKNEGRFGEESRKGQGEKMLCPTGVASNASSMWGMDLNDHLHAYYGGVSPSRKL